MMLVEHERVDVYDDMLRYSRLYNAWLFAVGITVIDISQSLRNGFAGQIMPRLRTNIFRQSRR